MRGQENVGREDRRDTQVPALGQHQGPRWARRSHCIAAVFLHGHAAGKGFIVGIDQQGSLSPVQHVSLHKDHVLHTSNLRRESPRKRH